jgi:RNA polymerase sigma factor (sigma-70 family)
MERYPQLSAVAQGELTAEYQEGLRAEETLRENPKLSARDRRRLTEAVARGRYAIEYLTASNFRLVLTIARERAVERWGTDRAVAALPDLVGEANIALVEAARAFNPNAGPQFPTYAARVIRDRMLMMLTREHPMRLPPSWNRLKRIASVRKPQLTVDLGRPPTRAELEADLLATCMAWAYEKLTEEQRRLPVVEQRQHQMDRLRKQGMLGAIEHLDEVMLYSKGLAALDAPLGEDGGSLMDVLGEADPSSPTATLEAEERTAAVAEVLAALPPRDREIILYRFGFIDGETWSYQKICDRHGVSSERIRQIEKAVLQHLRVPGTADHLAMFLDSKIRLDD